MNIPERREYPDKHLKRSDLKKDPFEQFRLWFEEEAVKGTYECNAMTLSTATRDGRPFGRTVLLKGIDQKGFIFYTHYESRKAREIAENPRGSLTFAWLDFPRQILVEGKIEKVSREQSEVYFLTRPRKSQMAAYVSKQGRELSSREELEAMFASAEKQFENQTIPLPDNWGGYRLIPDAFEFWQGRRSRLHDRFLYLREGDSWIIKRLSP